MIGRIYGKFKRLLSTKKILGSQFIDFKIEKKSRFKIRFSNEPVATWHQYFEQLSNSYDVWSAKSKVYLKTYIGKVDFPLVLWLGVQCS